MPDFWMDVDAALSEVPVNILPLIDDTDFTSRETGITYDQAGMDLVWNFVTTAGAMTQTAVTPTSGGDYDWSNQGDGMYSIEIPAAGGASINNDTEGFGWFTGYCTGVLPWRGPTIGFRAAGLNNLMIDSAYSATRGLSGTALPAAAADAAGGLPISDAGGLDLDTYLGRITGNVALASVLGALNDAAADGDPTNADTTMQYVKQLINILIGTAGVVAFPAAAAPGNGVSLAEVLRSVYDDTNELQTDDIPAAIAALNDPTAAEIVNEWETQSQADPTGFHVNVMEVESLDATDQIRDAVVDDATRIDASQLNTLSGHSPDNTIADVDDITGLNDLSAADVNAEVDTALSDIKLDHLVAVADADDPVNDSIIAKLAATSGDWSDFDETTDSLQSIRDSITDANPQNHSATANNETTGTLDAGDYTDTATVNTTYYQTSPAAVAVGGFGLNVDLTFNIGTGRVPDQVVVTGYFSSGAQRTVQVWAYDYNAGSYTQLSNSANDFGNAVANQTFQYPMTNNMVQVSDGEVKIRFTSTSTTVGDDWYCDYVNVTSVAQEAAGLTADSIQQAVWARGDSGHDEDTLGYNVSKIHLVHGDVVAVTSASQFTIDNGVAVNDAYNGMIITLEDKTDDHYETRRIVDYIGATKEVFLDRDLGFVPVADDDYYIMNAAYGDTNTTHVSGTAQTANDIGADTNQALVDIAALNDLSAAEVNAQVVDVMTVDTHAEPGQEAPPSTPTFEEMVHYLYKFLRNKTIATAAGIEVYNDAGAVVDHTATHSEVAGTYTRDEFVSGP